MSDSPAVRLQIEEMHRTYVQMTGQQVTLWGREWVWWEWIKRGLNVEDLRMLITHIKRERAAGRPVRGADLKFRNLAANADFAEEDIIELRARRRAWKAPAVRARDDVTAATGRPPTNTQPEARSAKDVIDSLAGQQAFEAFKKLKEEL